MHSRLADVSSIVYGKSSSEVVDEDGAVPIIGTGGEYGRASRAMFEAGVVVPRKGSLGNPQLSLAPFWATDTTFAVLPSKDVDTRWLYYCLLNYDLSKLNEATGVPSISRDWLEKISFFNPGFQKQTKIADILQTIDRAIEKTQALIDKYQQVKAGLMHDLFTRGIGPDGQLRPPRAQARELYQETSIGWVPKEWKAQSLREMAQLGIPHIKTGPFGSSLKGEHWVQEGVPVITIGALGEGEFLEDELLFVSEIYANHLVGYRIRPGEVVFSRVADVGRSVVIEPEQDGWIMSSNLMRIHLDDGKADPAFLQSLLSFDERVKRQIRCRVNSGGRDVANGEVLNSIVFAWPRIDEQKEIVARAAAINRVISEESELLNKFQKQKAGLMHDLLTGKVPVRVDAVAEPEAVNA
ncbi:hypothetical protein HBJ58_09745 [Halomonas desiderata]|uniref:restriction endonuclease subunit S n=1 Tax=Billgrantia desiderata TaxID=52021 RepID=UPI00174A7B55|nr:hypothetical protein [Halomonas desiderata]